MDSPTPRRTRLSAILPALLLLIATWPATALAAQERITPDEGAWVLRTTLPLGSDASGPGTSIGAARWIGARTTVGADLSFHVRDGGIEAGDQSNDQPWNWSLGIDGEVRRYGRSLGRIAPFLLGQAGFRYADSRQETTSAGARVAAGVGAEWYPVGGLSLGFWTGVAFGRTWSDDDRHEPPVSGWSWSLRSTRSHIQLSYAF